MEIETVNLIGGISENGLMTAARMSPLGRLMVKNNLRWLTRNGEKVLQMKDTLPMKVISPQMPGDANEDYVPKEVWIDVPMQEEKVEENAQLRKIVTRFLNILNIQEESMEGRIFNPVSITCCRVLLNEELNDILKKMRELCGSLP